LLATLRETRTRRGQTMAFGSLEDPEGAFDLVIFPEPYAQHRELLKRAHGAADVGEPLPLLVSGTLESVDPAKVILREAFELSQAEQHLAVQVHIRVLASEATRDRLQALGTVLKSHPGDCSVQLHLMIPGESETVMALPDARAVDPVEDLVRDVDGLFGRPVTEVAL